MGKALADERRKAGALPPPTLPPTPTPSQKRKNPPPVQKTWVSPPSPPCPNFYNVFPQGDPRRNIRPPGAPEGGGKNPPLNE